MVNNSNINNTILLINICINTNLQFFLYEIVVLNTNLLCQYGTALQIDYINNSGSHPRSRKARAQRISDNFLTICVGIF